MAIRDVEKELIRHTLTRVSGNRQEAARILGIGERTLYRKLKTYELGWVSGEGDRTSAASSRLRPPK